VHPGAQLVESTAGTPLRAVRVKTGQHGQISTRRLEAITA
jgi:hypothetical protein